MIPKKIYLTENVAWMCYDKADNHPIEFISVEWLKKCIEENSTKIHTARIIDVDRLLTAIEKS